MIVGVVALMMVQIAAVVAEVVVLLLRLLLMRMAHHAHRQTDHFVRQQIARLLQAVALVLYGLAFDFDRVCVQSAVSQSFDAVRLLH